MNTCIYEGNTAPDRLRPSAALLLSRAWPEAPVGSGVRRLRQRSSWKRQLRYKAKMKMQLLIQGPPRATTLRRS